jgi:hypothetical protein
MSTSITWPDSIRPAGGPHHIVIYIILESVTMSIFKCYTSKEEAYDVLDIVKQVDKERRYEIKMALLCGSVTSVPRDSRQIIAEIMGSVSTSISKLDSMSNLMSKDKLNSTRSSRNE